MKSTLQTSSLSVIETFVAGRLTLVPVCSSVPDPSTLPCFSSLFYHCWDREYSALHLNTRSVILVNINTGVPTVQPDTLVKQVETISHLHPRLIMKGKMTIKLVCRCIKTESKKLRWEFVYNNTALTIMFNYLQGLQQLFKGELIILIEPNKKHFD